MHSFGLPSGVHDADRLMLHIIDASTVVSGGYIPSGQTHFAFPFGCNRHIVQYFDRHTFFVKLLYLMACAYRIGPTLLRPEVRGMGICCPRSTVRILFLEAGVQYSLPANMSSLYGKFADSTITVLSDPSGLTDSMVFFRWSDQNSLPPML